ncbi:MAG: hypothetical protein C5B50_12530 [Verrucomicrobia bacterium]|nr:MAG: hypothetical protein C5B50_12530 [Verrucomicrobiota bacterium]
MGRPKLLLPWGRTSILGHIIGQWQTLGAKQILLVTRPNDSDLHQELARLGYYPEDHPQPHSAKIPLINTPLQRGETAPSAGQTASAVFPEPSAIENPNPDLGMFSSIQCAARWEGWNCAIHSYAIALADQPQIRTESLRQFLRFHSANPDAICQPSFEGHARHPVLLPKPAFNELKTTTASNLNDFLRLIAFHKVQCPINDPGLAFDVDTPEDYERVHSELQSQAPL